MINKADISEEELLELGKEIGEKIKLILGPRFVKLKDGYTLLDLRNFNIDEVGLDHFYYSDSIAAKIGSSTFTNRANGCVSITGFGLACTSLGKCFTAKNWFARAAYIGSISCGSGAAVASGLTTIKQDTWFNPYGFLSAGGSYILLRLGNQLHDTGRMLEGKQPRSIFRLPRNTVNSGKTAFTPIQHISTDSIPYSKIFNGCVLVITIYTYSQFVIASYRFTQRLVNKFKQQRKSKQIRKAAKCLIQSSSILKKYSYQRILVYS